MKGQAAESWLYGEDGEGERHLGRMEAAAAVAIRRLLATGRPPVRLGPDHHRLIYFVMLQFGRTPAAAAASNRTLDAIAKSFIRQQEPPSEVLAGLGKVVISDSDALQRVLRNALLGAPAVYDLAFKLIANVSRTPFVTSDNPVSLLNSFLSHGENLNTTGLGALGLQIWLPLSPDHGLLFYDDGTYRVGPNDSRVVRLSRDPHVEAFNRLTWAGANTNVYARPDADRAALARMAEAAEADRTPIREWLVETDLERTATTKRVRTEYHRAAPALSLDLPFIHRRIGTLDLTGVREAPMRNADWMYDLLVWGRMVRTGVMDPATYQHLTRQVPITPWAVRRR